MRSQVFIVLLVAFCSIQISFQSVDWLLNLIDPHISQWDSVESGSTNLTYSKAIDNIPGYIAAFGDVNNDKFTDLFVVESTIYNSLASDTLSVYEWSGSTSEYLEVENSILGDTYVAEILSVIPCDFNYDGLLDVLVHTCDNVTSQLTIYFQVDGDFGSPLTLSPKPSIQQVLLMDYNMDMLPDLFGTDENGDRVFWINGANNTWSSQTQTSEFPLSPISSPHSNAFVDITGDCLSDLVVFNTDGGKTMELWINEGSSYTLNNQFPLPEGAGQFTFADFDKDGTMDIVFPVCFPEPFCNETNAIYIVYNNQTPMCTSITGSGTNCTSPSDVCGNNGFSLPLQMNVTTSTDDIIIIPASAFGSTKFLWKFILTSNSTAPETLRAGDFNLDGYPDLMFQVVSATGVSSTQLWQSVPCDDTMCSGNAISMGRRYFQNYVDGTEALTNITNVYASTFMDLGEDGTLDMVIMRYSIQEGSPPRIIQGIQNSVDWGGYFFKVLGLNGLCTQWCDTDPKFPDPKPVGVNTPGVVFKYIYTNNDGEKEVAMGNQLTQSAYLSLQTPYVYFGLGTASNYIQTLYMGISITGGSRHYSSVADIIPNSQVAGYPSPPTSPRRWKFDILLRPSGMTFWTIVTCIITCILLAMLTIYFAWREKKEDKAERREKAHLFKL